MAARSWTGRELLVTSLCLFPIGAALYNFKKNRNTPSDKELLRRAQAIRRQLSPPRQSSFRVVAILLLDDGTTVVGANDEPGPWIGGAICAERAALLQLRTSSSRLDQQVTAVYIVTDALQPVTPGMLCREFMRGSPHVNSSETRIVLQSADEESLPEIHTLDELYPYPSIFEGKSVAEQLVISESQSRSIPDKLKRLKIPRISTKLLIEVYQAAKQAAQRDHAPILHPIGFGAAIGCLVDDKVLIQNATQRKAIEYGSTLDAVTQLAPSILDPKESSSVAVVMQVDHFGTIHGPFASARAMLVEHGLEETLCLCTSNDGDDLVAVPAKELAPYVPIFR